MTAKQEYEMKSFITYAHRGASEYCPENTFISFYRGVEMGANGIETDVQRTKDGVLVLFHDDTLDRVTGAEGAVVDYTYEELSKLLVKKGKLADRIPTLDDFLCHFAFRDITFAIELKVGDCEREIADLIFKHGVENKTVVTSFNLEYLCAFKKHAPTVRVGYLTCTPDEGCIKALTDMGAEEICPKGEEMTKEMVDLWHGMGFNVRAWGISNEEIMKHVYDIGADGMTVNFPDRLIGYIRTKESEK